MIDPGLLADVPRMVGGGLILLGCAFVLVGGLGLVRLDGFFARLHAGSIVDTLGAGLLLAGLMLHGGWSLASVKLGLILAFLLLTTPTAAHALAGAAHVMGVKGVKGGMDGRGASGRAAGEDAAPAPAASQGGAPSTR